MKVYLGPHPLPLDENISVVSVLRLLVSTSADAVSDDDAQVERDESGLSGKKRRKKKRGSGKK